MKKQKKPTKKKEKPFDFVLLTVVFLLLALGIIMVLSASAPSSLASSVAGDSYIYLRKQAISLAIGVIGMLIVSKIDYRNYKKFYKLAYIAAIVLLLLVPLIGVEVNGAKRWLNLGFTTVQPSEIAKLLLILFYAVVLSENKERLQKPLKGFLFYFALLGPVLGILILFQSHLSATIVILGITAIMMLVAGARIMHFVACIIAMAGGVLALVLFEPYRAARFVSFLNPWADAQGDGWQVIQSLYAIGSGGIFGQGLGESKQKYLYISEPHNDFIFSVLAEELGFIGCVAVIILFAIFVWKGIVIAMRAKDSFGSLLAAGITTLVAIQAIINIAVVTSSMPVTGMPLPFFSYGGTALIILLRIGGDTTEHI